MFVSFSKYYNNHNNIMHNNNYYTIIITIDHDNTVHCLDQVSQN